MSQHVEFFHSLILSWFNSLQLWSQQRNNQHGFWEQGCWKICSYRLKQWNCKPLKMERKIHTCLPIIIYGHPEEDWGVLEELYNALVGGLNDQTNWHLPWYLIIIPDCYLVEDDDYGAVSVFQDSLKCLLVNINWVIDQQKKRLMKIKPGAV